MLLATIFIVCEQIVPLFVDTLPRGVFVALTTLSLIGAMWARLVIQKNMQ